MGNYLPRTSTPAGKGARKSIPIVPLKRKFSEDGDTDASQSKRVCLRQAQSSPEPSPKPHLLNLPREIQDQIYGYVHRKIVLRSVTLDDQAVTTLENAPYVILLLSHTQLHDEYKQAAPFTNLPAHVRLDKDYAGPWRDLDHEDSAGGLLVSEEEEARNLAALTRVRQVTFRVTADKPLIPFGNRHLIEDPQALVSLAPLLGTIRVVHMRHLGKIETSKLKLEHYEKYKPGVEALPTPPTDLLGFGLVQAVCAQYLEWFGWERRDGFYEGYDVRMVGAYVFAKTKSCRSLWFREDLSEVLACETCSYGDFAVDPPELEEWRELDVSEGSLAGGLLG